MSLVEKIKSAKTTAFSFELLPPLKGNGIDGVYRTIDALREFDPKYINITTHRSEMVFRETAQGLFERVAERHRPGTVAIAAAIQNKYKITVVPHIRHLHLPSFWHKKVLSPCWAPPRVSQDSKPFRTKTE